MRSGRKTSEVKLFVILRSMRHCLQVTTIHIYYGNIVKRSILYCYSTYMGTQVLCFITLPSPKPLKPTERVYVFYSYTILKHACTPAFEVVGRRHGIITALLYVLSLAIQYVKMKQKEVFLPDDSSAHTDD